MARGARAPFSRDGDRYRVELDDPVRDAVGRLAGELRDLVTSQDPSSDPALSRLFPPAYPDDLLQNLEYERAAQGELRDGRLVAAETVVATVGAESLSEEELLCWMRTCNDLRLVLGTRLDLTEESTEDDFADDEGARGTYQTYALLSAVVESIVEALQE